jgi:hypothetical protein
LNTELIVLEAAILKHYDLSTTTAVLINPAFSVAEYPGYPASNALNGQLS